MKWIFLALSILISSFANAAELVVVVNPNNPISSLTVNQLSHIFLGQTSVFPNGSTAIALDSNDTLRHRFYQEILQKNPDQVDKYWARMIFTGKAQLPREVRVSDLKTILAETPGAIAYMESSMVDSGVKIIRIERSAPQKTP